MVVKQKRERKKSAMVFVKRVMVREGNELGKDGTVHG